MRAGKLQNRIEVQVATETRDEHGGVTETWDTVVKRWVDIRPLHGRELMLAQQVNSQVTLQVRMRYDKGLTLTSGYRLKHGDRILNIESIVDVKEQNREWLLMCKEGT